MKTAINFFLVCVLFSFLGCSKYEDGPAFSLLTKKARITNTWKMDKYIYDDGTSTNDVDNGTMKLDKDMTATLSLEATNGIALSGVWEFVDHKEGLRITFQVFSSTTIKDFKILRLKSKELWVYDKDEKVEMHMIPA